MACVGSDRNNLTSAVPSIGVKFIGVKGLVMGIEVDGRLLEYMRAHSGAIALELRAAHEPERAMDAMARARRAIFRVPHPEQPDSPYASFASGPEHGVRGPGFWFDMADAEAYDGVLERTLELVIAALDESALAEAVLTWPESSASIVMSAEDRERLRIVSATAATWADDDPALPERASGDTEATAQWPPPVGWSGRSPLPTPRFRLGATCGSDGRIYAIGGEAGTVLKTVEVYEPATDAWSRGGSLGLARRGPGVAAGSDGRVYAIGGFGGFHDGITTAEAYDPSEKRWQPIAPMRSKAHNEVGATAGPDGRIYAFSPIYPDSAVLEAYDPGADSWAVLAPPAASYSESAVTQVVSAPHAGICVFGADHAEVEAYDPLSDQWTRLSPLPKFLHGRAPAVGGDGRIYVMGGQPWELEPTGLVMAYERDDDRWVAVDPMPTPRCYLGCTSGPDGSLFAVGGVVRKGHKSERVGIVETFRSTSRP